MPAAAPRAATPAPSSRCDRPRRREEARAEPADKPGSVVDSHSSRPDVAIGLKQPTRMHRGPRHCIPIWSCSEWGLPCHAALAPRAVRSYRTVSPSPRTPKSRSAVCSLLHFPSARAAQALPGTLPCGARTFLGTAEAMTRLPGRLRGRHCTGSGESCGDSRFLSPDCGTPIPRPTQTPRHRAPSSAPR